MSLSDSGRRSVITVADMAATDCAPRNGSIRFSGGPRLTGLGEVLSGHTSRHVRRVASEGITAREGRQ